MLLFFWASETLTDISTMNEINGGNLSPISTKWDQCHQSILCVPDSWTQYKFSHKQNVCNRVCTKKAKVSPNLRLRSISSFGTVLLLKSFHTRRSLSLITGRHYSLSLQPPRFDMVIFNVQGIPH